MSILQRRGAALFLLTLAACSGGPQGVPVAGTVTSAQDQPLNHALVTFIPQGTTPGLGGFATTGEDGKFTIVPSQGGNGLPSGEYKVTVSRMLRKDGSPPLPDTPPIESDATETLPPTYTDRETTPLKATVDPATKSYDFKLNVKLNMP